MNGLTAIVLAASVGLPASYPLPTYNGSGAFNVQHVVDASKTDSLQYDVNDDMKDVVEWYRDRLKAQGFKILQDMESKDEAGFTRGQVMWSRCEGHSYSAVGVGSIASAGDAAGPPKPFAEISLQTGPTGC